MEILDKYVIKEKRLFGTSYAKVIVYENKGDIEWRVIIADETQYEKYMLNK